MGIGRGQWRARCVVACLKIIIGADMTVLYYFENISLGFSDPLSISCNGENTSVKNNILFCSRFDYFN